MALDAELQQLAEVQSGQDQSGSTSVMTLLSKEHIICANTGDSRAIVGLRSGKSGMKVKQISDDQTVKNTKERARILASGGQIRGDRIYVRGTDGPGLIPTRSYGDLSGAKAGIICDPTVETIQIGDKVAWLAIMSDGVWENVPQPYIGGTVGSSKGMEPAAARIVEEAKRVVQNGKKYKDDMTCLLVQFHNYGASKKSGDEKKPKREEKKEKHRTEEEVVLDSIKICRDALEAGAHEDDVLDMIHGVSPEVKQKIKVAVDAVAKDLRNHKAANPGTSSSGSPALSGKKTKSSGSAPSGQTKTKRR